MYVNYDNFVVLQGYLHIIKESLTRFGYKCEYTKDFSGVSKSDLVVFSTSVDAFKYYHMGYRNIIVWFQGLLGAESYMRNKSKLRSAVLNYMDRFALKKAQMVFFVSKYMQSYYETMSRTIFKHKAYVMPCFNETLDSSIFDKKDYSKKTFAYVGSLSVWQCFSETVGIYAEIEKKIPCTHFKVLTFDTEKAKQILEERKIKNYSVKCVPKEQVKKELEDVTYGFIIRRDTDVNRVATPTKISSYLSAGVLPIYSPCLNDFHIQVDGKKLAFALNAEGPVDGLIRFVNDGVDKDTVQKEIEELFDTYYSPENHINNIISLAKNCLE